MKNMNKIFEVFLQKKGYLKNKKWFFLIYFLALVAVLLISFFNISQSQTVFSISLKNYEVGQIADRTVIADKTITNTPDEEIVIQKGEMIIKRGFPITEDGYKKLTFLATTPSYFDMRSYANSILYFMLLSSLAVFLFSPSILGRELRVKEAAFVAVLFVLVYASAVYATKISVFSGPFAMPILLPASFSIILIVLLFGYRFAALFAFLLFFPVLYAASFNTVPAIFVLCSGLAAARIVQKMDKRINLVFAAVLIGILNWVFMFALQVIYGDNLENALFIGLLLAFNGFISGILVLGFLTPLEVLFNTASVFRLMDLSDLNHPLMRRMLLAAPGTYNHSMLVATLSESACNDIGANGLLARVGSYYHDMGKLEQPEYFVENQQAGNKHDEIKNPRLSVSIIRNHVKKGVEKARQMRFPNEVIDIIAQHHGNGVIAYFYNEALKLDPNTSPEEYSYTGTPPTSKEAAVVMIADTVEAACRTLENPSVPRLEKFIHQLIMKKYESGQLTKANITFKDLDTIQTAFVTILAGYYHTRIEYPNQKDVDDDDEQSKDSSRTIAKKNKGKKINSNE